MSVISNRESTDYIPFGGTASSMSSMSSSGRYSTVQTRAARRKAVDRIRRLNELRLQRLKAECEHDSIVEASELQVKEQSRKLEITRLELDIMESTIHSEVCDEEETDSHHQMSVPLLGQVDGSSLETIPYNTSAYVNLPATCGEKRGQQSSTEIHSYYVPVPHTASTLPLRKSCLDTVVPQQMPSGRSSDGIINREMVASNLLGSSNSTQSDAKVPQQILSGRFPDSITKREMVASNLLVSSNSTKSGAEVPQQMLSGRCPDGVTNREMVASNLLVSSNSTKSGAEVPQQMLSGRCPDGVTNREMVASNLLVSSNSTQSGTEVPQQMLSGRCPDGVTSREMVASNLLVSSNSTQSGTEVPQQMLSGRCPDGVTSREMVASNLLVASNSIQSGAEVPQEIWFGRPPDGVTDRKEATSNLSVFQNSMHPGVDVAQQISSSRYIGGDVNIEVCAHNPRTHSSNPNVNHQSGARWHPPRLNQSGMASTPLDHENTAMAAEANFEIPSRDAVPATSHVSYDEPARVLPPAAQLAGANVHAPTWIPAQPGYMSTTSAVPHSDIRPPVSIPCNDMTSRNRNFQYRISHPTHVTDLSSTDPELSNRDVRNTIMERDRNELSNIDVYEKMAAAMRDSISLPKPELLTFDGSSRMYMQFMRNFECNISNRVPDYRLKLQYLIQYCNAEVQNYISSCIMMEPKEGYNKALEILATRYGSPHVVQRSYLKKVLDGAQLRPSDSQGLSDLAHDMQQCSIALKSLGYKCDLDSGETMLKISRRFPTHVRARWIRESSNIINRYNRDPTFEEMTSYILEEAKIANTMFGQDFYHDATRDQKSVRTTMRHTDNPSTKIKATTLVTQNTTGERDHKEILCSVCDEDNHPVWKCDKFITMCTDDRKQLVRPHKWCSNCFSKKHEVTDCHHEKKLCNIRECEDTHKHNTLLCLSTRNTTR